MNRYPGIKKTTRWLIAYISCQFKCERNISYMAKWSILIMNDVGANLLAQGVNTWGESPTPPSYQLSIQSQPSSIISTVINHWKKLHIYIYIRAHIVYTCVHTFMHTYMRVYYVRKHVGYTHSCVKEVQREK